MVCTRMNPSETYRPLLDDLPGLVRELERSLPYVSFLFVRDDPLAVWTTGRRSGCRGGLPETGLVMRIWDGICIREFGTNRLRPGEVLRWARDRAAEVRPVPGGEAWPEREDVEGDFQAACAVDPAEVSVEKKFADVAAIHDRILGAEPSVKSARVTYDETRTFKAFVDRHRRLTQSLCFVGAAYAVFASDGKGTRYAHGGNKLAGGYELLEGAASDDAIDEAVRTARDALRAEKVPPGLHQIVTAPLVSATVAHEAFGHGVEMDMLVKGCARAGEFFDRPVASEHVTLLDSPDLSNSAGFSFFDDEGEISRSTTIIEDGILRSGLTDAYSAWRLGVPPTPNGRRESFRRKVFSRMTNTHFRAGDRRPQDILGAVDRGIYLCGGGMGMEDPLGWGIQIDIRVGYEIRGGALTGRVFAPVVLTGNVPDLLGSISAVGEDLRTFGFGKCGKTFRKDWILVGMGGPTLCMEGRLA
jgi:TldD protein